MTFRKLALATAMTSITALAANASSTMSTDVITEDGKTYEDAAVVGNDTDSMVNVNDYEENGHDKSSVTISNSDPAQGTSEEIASYKTEALGTLTEYEVVMKAAQPGVMLRTNDGEVVGTVIGTRDRGEAGPLVIVDVDDAYQWPIDQVAFEIKSLSAIEEGPGLEYDLSMKTLVDAIVDHAS